MGELTYLWKHTEVGAVTTFEVQIVEIFCRIIEGNVDQISELEYLCLKMEWRRGGMEAVTGSDKAVGVLPQMTSEMKQSPLRLMQTFR